MRTVLAFLLGGALLAASTAARADDVKVLKIATLAPEGSPWMKLFREWSATVEKNSGNTLKIKFYAGGSMGDEREAVRKMRLGQINGAAVTAVGLGLIQPEVRLLELPFLVHGYDELDFIRGTLDADIRKKFEEKGYVLLGWGDVGPVHLFTNQPIKTKADIQRAKIWAWTDDPIVKTLFEQLGLNGVPLGVPDVLPALQTGRIDACYGSPLSTVALQWHSKIKYITSMVMSQAIGASVVTKAFWDGLTAAQRKVIVDASKDLEAKLLKSLRADNDSYLNKMKSQGIQLVETPPELIKEFEAQAHIVGTKLEGQVYTKEFHARVDKLLADRRAGKK